MKKQDNKNTERKKFKVWCQCGDLMEPNPYDKFQKVYGKAFECFGCQRTVYIEE